MCNFIKNKKKMVTTALRQNPLISQLHMLNGLENEVKVSHKGSVQQNRVIFKLLPCRGKIKG